MKFSYQGQWDLPSFRGPDGIVYVWDPSSQTMVAKADHEVRPDRGHATGGDNDLFDPFTHTEQPGSPLTEGYMSSTHVATPGRPGMDEMYPGASPEEIQQRYWDEFSDQDERAREEGESGLWNHVHHHAEQPDPNCSYCQQVGAIDPGPQPLQIIANEWASAGKVKCPNCTSVTDQAACPACGKDLTPEWHNEQARQEQTEFQGVHPPFDPRNEFISDPERVPKRNPDKTDDSFPSMNLSHTARVRNVRPPYFSSFAEELVWREANDKSLDDCPECNDVMHNQDGEMICHGCGHKQKIITAGAAALIAPELMGGIGGGAEAAGIGGVGGVGGFSGLPQIGQLMGLAMGGGHHGQEQQAPPPDDPYAAPGTISHVRQSGLLGDIVEGIMHAFRNVPGTALQGLQAAPGAASGLVQKGMDAMADPANPLSYADDIAGAVIPHANQQQTFSKTFGEDEVGLATKNDGNNSDPDDQTSSGSSSKEHGDSPEQLKDTDDIGGPTSGDEADQLADQGGADTDGDPHSQDKALKAFHMNMPLIIEFAESPESGSSNPILMAIDQLLEGAFPGYRDGQGDGTSEHPLEGNNVPSEDESGEAPETGDSKDDAASKKEASVWAKQGLWFVADRNKGTWGEKDDDDDDFDAEDFAHQEHEDESHEHEEKGDEGHEKAAQTAPNLVPGQANQWGSGTYPGDTFAGGAPGIAGAPQPCTQCGQMHAPGTPCAQDATQNIPQPMSNGAPVSPPFSPNTVTTKWEHISSVEYLSAREATTDKIIEIATAALLDSSIDDEFGFYGQKRASEPHHHEHRQSADWMDADGAPLQSGHDYDLIADDYAIPDKITVNEVYPDKISYTMHPASNDPASLPFHAELSRQEYQTMGYQFMPSEHASAVEDASAREHPVRPGQDPTPQVDDLSTPSTVVSGFDPMEYVAKFDGDSLEDRSWIFEGSDVAVDPALMAKLAGKNFSGQEQRAFIDEDGTARNLDKLDLSGTHYVDDQLDNELALW